VFWAKNLSGVPKQAEECYSVGHWGYEAIWEVK